MTAIIAPSIVERTSLFRTELPSLDRLRRRYSDFVTHATYVGATVRVRDMRVVALTLAALALAPSLAGAAPQLRSGLRGVVMRGPTKPVCLENEPCEAVGVVLHFGCRAGQFVAQVKTGARGGYIVGLRPGAYVVSTPLRRVGSMLAPRSARVPQGRVARVNFHIDTGIQ